MNPPIISRAALVATPRRPVLQTRSRLTAMRALAVLSAGLVLTPATLSASAAKATPAEELHWERLFPNERKTKLGRALQRLVNWLRRTFKKPQKGVVRRRTPRKYIAATPNLPTVHEESEPLDGELTPPTTPTPRTRNLPVARRNPITFAELHAAFAPRMPLAHGRRQLTPEELKIPMEQALQQASEKLTKSQLRSAEEGVVTPAQVMRAAGYLRRYADANGSNAQVRAALMADDCPLKPILGGDTKGLIDVLDSIPKDRLANARVMVGPNWRITDVDL